VKSTISKNSASHSPHEKKSDTSSPKPCKEKHKLSNIEHLRHKKTMTIASIPWDDSHDISPSRGRKWLQNVRWITGWILDLSDLSDLKKCLKTSEFWVNHYNCDMFGGIPVFDSVQLVKITPISLFTGDISWYIYTIVRRWYIMIYLYYGL
jgi:hypothetical protein